MPFHPTLGTDPEFFLFDKNIEKYISAIPLIKGTKTEPDTLPRGGFVIHDNVTIEFSTDIAKDGTELIKMVSNALEDIYTLIPKGLDIVAVPSAIFDPDQLDHPDAQTFGCSEDYNAWALQTNIPPSPIDNNLRSCGGHLHIGCLSDKNISFLLDSVGKIHAVRAMDFVHGIISIILDSGETSHQRRELYGKAGCYRFTAYGIEYRVLSNFWLKNATNIMLMYYLTLDVLSILKKEEKNILNAEKLMNDFNIKPIQEVGSELIQNTINDGDSEVAKILLDKHISKHLSDDSLFFLENAIEISKKETHTINNKELFDEKDLTPLKYKCNTVLH